MTETTQACTRGCSMYRQHLAECEGAQDDETCRGCLPRRATNGNLCDTCHRRFELMLTDAPVVYRWLTGNLSGPADVSAEPDLSKWAGDRPELGANTRLPISAAIFDVRQTLADQLALWVDDFAEDVDLTKPDRSTVEADAAFLLRWIKSLELCDWIGDWWEELAETMSQAHALAPWRPSMRRIKRVPCPGCAETNLVIFGGESDVTCLSCRIMMTEERFGLWERVLKMETAEEAS